MYQLLQEEKQRLTVMWAHIAPHEPTADLTPADKGILEGVWIAIAPHELYDYKATCLEQKGAFELAHNIPDFFAPAVDEWVKFEDDCRAHADSYIIWK